MSYRYRYLSEVALESAHDQPSTRTQNERRNEDDDASFASMVSSILNETDRNFTVFALVLVSQGNVIKPAPGKLMGGFTACTAPREPILALESDVHQTPILPCFSDILVNAATLAISTPIPSTVKWNLRRLVARNPSAAQRSKWQKESPSI